MISKRKRKRRRLVRAMRKSLDRMRQRGPATVPRILNILDGLVMLLEFENGLREWKKP